MATETEAKTYRDDLLKVGVAAADFNNELYSLLKSRVEKSDGNPASAVNGVSVEDVVMCGALRVKEKDFILVLPRDRAAFEAVIDFLRFEAMRKAPRLLSIAISVEAYGVKHKILDKTELRGGTTRIAKREVDQKTHIASESIKDGHRAEVIDCWAVHKDIDGGKGYRVTHRTLGRAINSGPIPKKAATQLAKTLGESQYPWRLLTDVTQANKKEWKTAKEFALKAIEKASGTKKVANPIF